MNICIEKTSLCFEQKHHITYEEIRNSIEAVENDIVYLGGSLIEGVLSPISEGMGNRYSDIDVFIIRKHDDFVSTKFVYGDVVRKTFFYNESILGIDVEVYDEDFVWKLIETLNTVEIKADEKVYNVFLGYLPDCCNFEMINSFLSRLTNSVCIYGMGRYEEIKKKINFQRFLEMMISNTVVHIDNILEDVQGNLEIKQFNVALFCMRRVVLNVMFILLMNNGIFVDREKWIQLKFDNLCRTKPEFLIYKYSFDRLFRGDLLQDEICNHVILQTLNDSKQVIEAVLMGELQI